MIQVSYSLLVFFCGMFITVDGFNKTGIPSAFWNFMEPYARINHASGVAVLSLVILLLSNVASNVPTGEPVSGHKKMLFTSRYRPLVVIQSYPTFCHFGCSAASWRAGGEVGGGAVALGGGAGVADTGVGEHGGGELVAAGVGGEPDRVRAGAAVAGLRLHPLLLGPPRLRPPLHPHRHRRRSPPHPRLTNLPTCRSLEEECEIN